MLNQHSVMNVAIRIKGFNSTQFNSIQLNSTQFNSIQLNRRILLKYHINNSNYNKPLFVMDSINVNLFIIFVIIIIINGILC